MEAPALVRSSGGGARTADRAMFVTACIATAVYCAISWLPTGGPTNYRYSFLFLVPAVWAIYSSRRRFELHPVHFALFAVALLLHDLGAFGCYTRSYLGLQFDWYVHFYFGLAGGLIVARALARKLPLGRVAVTVSTVLLVTGLGGLHEIMEAGSTLWLGPEQGMFKSNGDPFDTQQDLLNNVLGSLLAAAIQAWTNRSRGAR